MKSSTNTTNFLQATVKDDRLTQEERKRQMRIVNRQQYILNAGTIFYDVERLKLELQKIFPGTEWTEADNELYEEGFPEQKKIVTRSNDINVVKMYAFQKGILDCNEAKKKQKVLDQKDLDAMTTILGGKLMDNFNKELITSSLVNILVELHLLGLHYCEDFDCRENPKHRDIKLTLPYLSPNLPGSELEQLSDIELARALSTLSSDQKTYLNDNLPSARLENIVSLIPANSDVVQPVSPDRTIICAKEFVKQCDSLKAIIDKQEAQMENIRRETKYNASMASASPSEIVTFQKQYPDFKPMRRGVYTAGGKKKKNKKTHRRRR